MVNIFSLNIFAWYNQKIAQYYYANCIILVFLLNNKTTISYSKMHAKQNLKKKNKKSLGDHFQVRATHGTKLKN